MARMKSTEGVSGRAGSVAGFSINRNLDYTAAPVPEPAQRPASSDSMALDSGGPSMRAIMKAGGALLVTGALAAAAAPSFPFAASAPRPGVDWPQFRGIKADGTSDAHAT